MTAHERDYYTRLKPMEDEADREWPERRRDEADR